MKDLLIATKNKHKFKEISEIFKEVGFSTKSLLDFPNISSVKETGKNFKENAEKKAIVYSRETDLLAIADDSGLVVDKLDGKPGVYSSRFAGLDATDKDNNKKLMQMLEGIPVEHRKAAFICYIAIAESGNLIDGFKGKCEGSISLENRGDTGFGYDPVFVPDGYDKTFAELGQEVKNKLSHRYKALIKTKEKLKELI